ncbi:PTS lichenan transporter subunit IIA [Schumannella luteola]|uniref:PTS system cellobiose-specific IIA component n=1 Tax=Schumannella luteola TaxID=472059 RepID=A0A852YAT0_9MICO|nr:PTS system cellobiose-specific IIA component [Schumannella luteola]
MNDEDYAAAFELISAAGGARSDAMLALRAARDGDEAGAQQLLAQADQQLLAAHRMQTTLIQQEAGGSPIPVNIILVHAQDHLTSAMITKDLAVEIVALHARLGARAGEQS